MLYLRIRNQKKEDHVKRNRDSSTPQQRIGKTQA
jgi:hypothetical protein